MATNREGFMFDFRKGGQLQRESKKAAQAAAKKAAAKPPANDLTAGKRRDLAASTFGLPAEKKKVDRKAKRILHDDEGDHEYR
jgi:hypothetical protein